MLSADHHLCQLVPEAEYRVEEVRASKQRRQGLQLLSLEDPNKASKRNQVKKRNYQIEKDTK